MERVKYFVAGILVKLGLYWRFFECRDIIKSAWAESVDMNRLAPQKSRLSHFCSMAFWGVFTGVTTKMYSTFRFWERGFADKANFLTSIREYKLAHKLCSPESIEIFRDKGLFNRHFAKFQKRKWLDCRGATARDIEEFVSQFDAVIIKPMFDWSGNGVRKVSSADVDSNALCGRDVMIEEIICNSEAIRKLAPASLNTIRMVTVVDKDRKVHIIGAALRIGNGTNIIDNIDGGGMACKIDVATGRLCGSAISGIKDRLAEHPVTHIRFDGFKVEGFDLCVRMLDELTSVLPDARYTGWDLAITPHGIEVIEGNAPCGVQLTQIAAGHSVWREMKSLV